MLLPIHNDYVIWPNASARDQLSVETSLLHVHNCMGRSLSSQRQYYLREFILQRLAAVSNSVHVVVPHAMFVLQAATPRAFATLLSILTTVYINA